MAKGNNGRLGCKHTEETKRKIGLSNSIALKGITPWNKGKKETRKDVLASMSLSHKGKAIPPEQREKLRQANLGEKGSNWMGDLVGYVGIHARIKKDLGKPGKCEICNTKNTSRYEWANKDHNYRYCLKDWMSLCVSCHKKYDYRFNIFNNLNKTMEKIQERLDAVTKEFEELQKTRQGLVEQGKVLQQKLNEVDTRMVQLQGANEELASLKVALASAKETKLDVSKEK